MRDIQSVVYENINIYCIHILSLSGFVRCLFIYIVCARARFYNLSNPSFPLMTFCLYAKTVLLFLIYHFLSIMMMMVWHVCFICCLAAWLPASMPVYFYFNEATAVQHHSWRLPCTKTLTRGKREKKSTWQWRRICMYVIDGVMEAVWCARKRCMNPIIHRVIKALAISALKKTLQGLRGNYRTPNSFSSFLSFLC